MDALGEDADELGYDEVPPARSYSFLSTEALAVASLTLAACSLLAGGLMQYISFAFSSPFDNPRGQYLVYISPTVVFAALAVALGLAVTRRGDEGPWTTGIAGAAVIVGGLVLLISLVGVVLALTLDSAEGFGFRPLP